MNSSPNKVIETDFFGKRAEDEKIIEIKDLFCEVEKKLKQAELETELLATPILNELRYASFHILSAITSQGERKDEELKRAERHCKRAYYDVMEIRLLVCFAKIKDFKEDYGKIIISDVISDYNKLLEKINKIKNSYESIKAKSREEYYQEIDKSLEELSQIAQTLEAAREELNKKMRIERRKIILTLAGLAITTIAAIFTTLAYFSE